MSSKYSDIRKNCKILSSNDILKIIIIDVGQGDSILIKYKEDFILIDSGPTKSFAILDSYLESLSCKKIKYHIITHPHIDHNGNSLNVAKKYKIENLVINYPSDYLKNVLTKESNKVFSFNDSKITSNSLINIRQRNRNNIFNEINSFDISMDTANLSKNILYAEDIDYINIDDLKITILHPKYLLNESNINNYSISLLITLKDFSFITMGDCDETVESQIIRSQSLSNVSDVNLFKVNHHGSSTSNSDKLLKFIKPKISVISSGINNTFNHPTKDALSRLKLYSNVVYRTDTHGSFIISYNSKGLTTNFK